MLRAARAMREADEVILLADDPVALIDVPALAQAHGWTIEMSSEAAHHVYRLKAAANPQ